MTLCLCHFVLVCVRPDLGVCRELMSSHVKIGAVRNCGMTVSSKMYVKESRANEL